MSLQVEAAPADPFFPPGSLVRRVHQEGILLLGGGRALLMHIAHPKIAQAVADHSSYRRDRAGRLLRTVRATLAIAYGTREQAFAAAEGVNRLHRGVNGPGYDALDPDLLVWVLATLIDTTLVMHERFVGFLTEQEAEEYYAQASEVGALFCVPEGHMPRDLAALRTYIGEMSAELQVSNTARGIAADLFAPMPATGPMMTVLRQLTAGLLPAPLRHGYGMTWGSLREGQLQVAQSLSRMLLPRAPLPLRRTPDFLLPPKN